MSRGKEIVMYDMATGAMLKELQAHFSPVRCLAHHPANVVRACI